MILYKFERDYNQEKKQEESATEPATEPTPVIKKRAAEIEPIPIPSPVEEQDWDTVDMVRLVKMLRIADALEKLCEKVNSNPDTANSVSMEIQEICMTFRETFSEAFFSINTFGFNGSYNMQPSFAFSSKELNYAMDDFETMLEVCCGDELYDYITEALESDDEEKLDELNKYNQEYAEDFDEAGEAQPPRDPLIIDLGDSGIVLHSLENGVYFDLDNNGFAERTAWIDIEDGFLALDRNNNGTIDNGGELFGDQVKLSDGSKSSSGFEALKELDGNEDDVIDENDETYEKLRVWIDSNHNGKSESNELKTLDDLGVISISLEHEEISYIDEETGTRIAERADVKIDIDGVVSTVDISEFWFPVNSSDTTHGDKVTVGNVPDIMQAIQNDENGELFDMFMKFSESDDIAYKHYLTKAILVKYVNIAFETSL